MLNWTKYFWPGLVTTALLTTLLIWFQTENLQNLLKSNLSNSLLEEKDWLKISLSGRDATLSGVSPSEESLQQALNKAKTVHGVRIVENNTRELPVVSPYKLVIGKHEDGIFAKGHVARKRIENEIANIISSLAPGIAFSSEFELATGAPDEMMNFVEFAATQLGYLINGELILEDKEVYISGEPIDGKSYEALLANFINLPSGLKTARIDLAVPRALEPYYVNVDVTKDNLNLSGYASSLSDKAMTKSYLRRHDYTQSNYNVASGQPEGVNWSAATIFAVESAANLISGKVSIIENTFSVEGVAKDFDAHYYLSKLMLKELPDGIVAGSINITRNPDNRDVLRVMDTGQKIKVTGYLPDKEAALLLIKNAKKTFGLNLSAYFLRDDKVSKAQVKLLANLMPSLARLDDVSFSMQENAGVLSGKVLFAQTTKALTAYLKAAVPKGFALSSEIGVVDIPNAENGLLVDGQTCEKNLKQLLSQNRIYFASGNAEINAASYGLLDRLAYTGTKCPQKSFRIEGHTDSDGAEGENLKLSEARANAVISYLVNLGIAPARLITIAYGETKPLVANDSPQNKLKNRRIEFKLVGE